MKRREKLRKDGGRPQNTGFSRYFGCFESFSIGNRGLSKVPSCLFGKKHEETKMI